jgi:hypothetical protein
MKIKHVEVVMENMILSQHLYGGSEEKHKNLGPNSLSLGQDVNTIPPEYDMSATY